MFLPKLYDLDCWRVISINGINAFINALAVR